MPFDNPYAPPQANLSPPAALQPTFFVVAPRKLLLMVLLSQGFYSFYWSYKHWSLYRAATGARVLPLVRAFFSVFFIYALAMNIKRVLDLKERPYRWWPRCFALGWITCTFLPLTFLWYVSPFNGLKISLCLLIVQAALSVQIQQAVNHLENDPQGHANSRLTWANGIWILIGMSFWALAVIEALYFPFL